MTRMILDPIFQNISLQDLEELKRLIVQSGAPEIFHAGILKQVQLIAEKAALSGQRSVI